VHRTEQQFAKRRGAIPWPVLRSLPRGDLRAEALLAMAWMIYSPLFMQIQLPPMPSPHITFSEVSTTSGTVVTTIFLVLGVVAILAFFQPFKGWIDRVNSHWDDWRAKKNKESIPLQFEKLKAELAEIKTSWQIPLLKLIARCLQSLFAILIVFALIASGTTPLRIRQLLSILVMLLSIAAINDVLRTTARFSTEGILKLQTRFEDLKKKISKYSTSPPTTN
jgi:hypothetical protein